MSSSLLERSAEADLFRNTLSRIPTVFGRLAYLGSLYDRDSGVYVHHGLMSIYGNRRSRQALAQTHREVFREWLNLPLADKVEDLTRYVNALDHPAAFLEYPAQGPGSRNYVPKALRKAEKTLFFEELEILRDILASKLEAASVTYRRK